MNTRKNTMVEPTPLFPAKPEPAAAEAGADDRSAVPLTPEEEEALSQEERDFREVSVDVDDPSRAPAIILKVTKTPDKELFYRTKIGFELKLHLLLSQQNGQIDVSYLAVTQSMVEPLREKAMAPNLYKIYLTISRAGQLRLIPIRMDSDNSYTTSLEEGLTAGQAQWVRTSTDREEQVYRTFPLPLGQYPDPIWPVDLTPSKAVQLVWRSKGRLIDSVTHPYFLKITTGKPTIDKSSI